MSAIEVFFSYSHKDDNFSEELEKHFKVLQRQGIISLGTIGESPQAVNRRNKYIRISNGHKSLVENFVARLSLRKESKINVIYYREFLLSHRR